MMSDTSSNKYDEQLAQYEQWRKIEEPSLKHWRAWGSWFSWGSPVGLGLFLISVAIAIWTIKQAF